MQLQKREKDLMNLIKMMNRKGEIYYETWEIAPVAGVYGTFWGIVAGWLHLAVVQSIGTVHGGLNLYNNGFSAGIVAVFLLPIMNTIKEHRDK